MYTKSANNSTPRSFGKKGFSLVEVTIAMGLVVFCLVAMLGVLPVGLKQELQSSDQLVATQLMAAVENDFQNATNAEKTDNYPIETKNGKKGSFLVDNSLGYTTKMSDAQYSVTYQISGATTNDATRMHLFISKARSSTLAAGNVVAEGIVQKQL